MQIYKWVPAKIDDQSLTTALKHNGSTPSSSILNSNATDITDQDAPKISECLGSGPILSNGKSQLDINGDSSNSTNGINLGTRIDETDSNGHSLNKETNDKENMVESPAIGIQQASSITALSDEDIIKKISAKQEISVQEELAKLKREQEERETLKKKEKEEEEAKRTLEEVVDEPIVDIKIQIDNPEPTTQNKAQKRPFDNIGGDSLDNDTISDEVPSKQLKGDDPVDHETLKSSDKSKSQDESRNLDEESKKPDERIEGDDIKVADPVGGEKEPEKTSQ